MVVRRDCLFWRCAPVCEKVGREPYLEDTAARGVKCHCAVVAALLDGLCSCVFGPRLCGCVKCHCAVVRFRAMLLCEEPPSPRRGGVR